jgi:hypothetical protein
MTDQVASYAVLTNMGAFVTRFSIIWDGGETDRSDELAIGQSVTIDLKPYHKQVHRGTSCCARAYIEAGPNHNSGRNFTFDVTEEAPVEYTISGSVFDPSFD